MSNTKQKLQKEKKRRVRAKERVMRRRVETRQANKWTKEQKQKAEQIDKMKRKHPKQMKCYEESNLERLPLGTLKKLEKNMCILGSLEEEYNREMEQKNQLNEDLESEGHVTFEEKMQALNTEQIQRLREQENNKLGEFGGTAECSFAVNKPKKDTCDVDVVKANVTEVNTDLEDNTEI